MSSITIFHINLTFNIIVLWVDLSNSFIIAKPEILSKNGASILLTFELLVLILSLLLEIWVLTYLRSWSNILVSLLILLIQTHFLIPKTISTFSCIWDTKVYILNLWPCILGWWKVCLHIVHCLLEFFVFLMQI